MKKSNQQLLEETTFVILYKVIRMKLTSIQFYFSVVKQEEEVNNNTEETLKTLLRRYTTKRKLRKKTEKKFKMLDIREKESTRITEREERSKN